MILKSSLETLSDVLSSFEFSAHITVMSDEPHIQNYKHDCDALRISFLGNLSDKSNLPSLLVYNSFYEYTSFLRLLRMSILFQPRIYIILY